MVSALATMYVTYGRTEFLVVICVSGVFCLFLAVFAAIIAGEGPRPRKTGGAERQLPRMQGLHPTVHKLTLLHPA